MKKILCLCALALVFCSACRDKEANVLIFASDMEPQAYVQAGQRLLIRVRAYAEETTLSRVLISSIDAETGSRPVKDTSVGSTSSEFYFMYTVPAYFSADTTAMTLQFEVFSVDGKSSKMVLPYKVVGGGALRSHDGIVMYAMYSGRPNGFSLASVQTLFCETSDSADIDFYAYHDTLSTDSATLSREWRSRTGLQFARLNDFDYAGANRLMLGNTYKAARRYTSVKELAEGDILLFGRGEEAIGALQLLMVVDEAGTANDRYVFNMKLKY
ncbi:MAG: hypothetical protein J5873_01530 [Bacteroidales bacterium]|nr:hypothetical protein [Bacteroidales bacterium]